MHHLCLDDDQLRLFLHLIKMVNETDFDVFEQVPKACDFPPSKLQHTFDLLKSFVEQPWDDAAPGEGYFDQQAARKGLRR